MAKALVPLAIAGMAAIPALPTEWLQLGVAGVSLTILFWFITRTHPQALKDERESNNANMARLFEKHSESTDAIVGRIDAMADRQMRLMEKALGVAEVCDDRK